MEQDKRMNVYFISGLGADRRAFKKLSLPPHWSVHHLDWIEPKEKETLNQYAQRLSLLIDPGQPFILVGLSFGGMVASAMANYIHPEKIILISSIGTPGELPWYFRLAGRIGLHKLIPSKILTKPNRVLDWIFGARSESEKRLLGAIISDTNPRFIRWSLNAITSWEKSSRPPGIFHIHGSRDKILPVRFTKPNIVIRNGSHFMVWTKAGEVSAALVAAAENHKKSKS